MIAYLKLVRRLLHRYALPALCPTLLAMTAAGCALASTATQPPDRGFVSDGHGGLQFPFRGVNRATVIEQFGQPDSVERVQDKEVDVYESDPASPYKKGLPDRWFDFVGFFFLDVVTLGVVDLSVTLPSLGEKREYYVYSVAYSPEGKVESVSTERKKYWLPPPPLPTPNATGCTPNC